MLVDIQARLATFSKLVSEKSLLQTARLIWENDRQFTYPAFQKTAKKVTSRLKSWDIDAEICHVQADGKTRHGDWTMPMGWDCTGATLSIRASRGTAGNKWRVLADRKDRPTHTIMWSGPTPPNGIIAPAILIKDLADLKRRLRQIPGKIVVTPSHPQQFKRLLVKNGALAVVTSFCRNATLLPDAAFWFNMGSDDPSGWAFQAGDTPFPGMVVSPRVGEELAARIKRGPTSLKIIIRSRYFESTLPVVSGFAPGRSNEEVLAIGHAMEQGVNDNASGCAVILESLRAIHAGARAGKIAPLQRGVRGVLTNECYGTMGYAALNPDVMRRTLAAINWDTVGRHQESTDAVFRHHRCADASASVTDSLMVVLLETWLGKKVRYANISKNRPFALTDNAYNDPDIGVPCVYVDSQDRFWHTSADTFDQISGPTLHAFAVISATWLHFLATAGANEAIWMAQQTLRDYALRLEDAAASFSAPPIRPEGSAAVRLSLTLDKIDYLGEIGLTSLASARQFMPPHPTAAQKRNLAKLSNHLRWLVDVQKRRVRDLAGVQPATLTTPSNIADIAQRRPRKNFIGTPTYDSIPLKLKSTIDSPMWDARIHCALFWSRGALTFSEIARRVRCEFDRDCTQLLATHFRFMAQHGLLEWK